MLFEPTNGGPNSKFRYFAGKLPSITVNSNKSEGRMDWRIWDLIGTWSNMRSIGQIDGAK
jgi:hypothetical protein